MTGIHFLRRSHFYRLLTTSTLRPIGRQGLSVDWFCLSSRLSIDGFFTELPLRSFSSSQVQEDDPSSTRFGSYEVQNTVSSLPSPSLRLQGLGDSDLPPATKPERRPARKRKPLRNERNVRRTLNMRGNKIKKSVPGTLFNRNRTRETFFQWDYRNHPRVKDVFMLGYLNEIALILKNVNLEPFGKYRGVETMRQNILNMELSARRRIMTCLAYGKFVDKDMYQYLMDDVIIESLGKTLDKERQQKALSPGPMRRALFELLCHRHAIYASGRIFDLNSVSYDLLGKSFFGPNARVNLSARQVKLILKELWTLGVSQRMNVVHWNYYGDYKRNKENKYAKGSKVEVKKDERYCVLVGAEDSEPPNISR